MGDTSIDDRWHPKIPTKIPAAHDITISAAEFDVSAAEVIGTGGDADVSSSMHSNPL